MKRLLYNNLGFTWFGPDVTEKTQDVTFHFSSDSSYHFIIITLVGAGDGKKDRHLPATLLKVYNYEEETCRTTKQELKLTDGSLTWMKTQAVISVSRLINTFCSWMLHTVVGQGASNIIFSALQPAD